MSNKEKSVVICIGHHKKDQGAASPGSGITEWMINAPLAEAVSRQLIVRGFKVTVIADKTLTQKVKAINIINPDVAVDLHLNALNGTVSGHEVIYWSGSYYAGVLSDCITSMISFNKNRGKKPVIRENGAFFCRNTHATSVVVESAFIDNPDDFFRFIVNIELIAREIAIGINMFFSIIDKMLKEVNK